MKFRLISFLSFLCVAGWAQAQQNGLRAPAYPLITIDPMTSVWSAGDYLYDQQTTHWSGLPYPLVGAIRVDSEVYRFMGTDGVSEPSVAMDGERYFGKTARQISVQVSAMATVYLFDCEKVELEISFIAPLFTDDLELMTRPVNYIKYIIKSKNGLRHNVQLYLEASPLVAVHSAEQESEAQVVKDDRLTMVRTGSKAQRVLARVGDQVKIDWGYFYFAADKKSTTAVVGDAMTMRCEFAKNGAVQSVEHKTNGSIALIHNPGKIIAGGGLFMVGYDEIYAIQYMGQNLRPYWNRDGKSTISEQFNRALTDYNGIVKVESLVNGHKQMVNSYPLQDKIRLFCAELYNEAYQAGGEKYAQLCELAYRQSIAAHELVVAPNGELLFFSKECASNGSIGTVDITYPSAPMFLYYNVELVKGMMNFIFAFCRSDKWTKPFPPHDLGTYPQANGQTYSTDMPVEEAGNMLILTAAIAQREGNVNYAAKYWDTLTEWTDYLVENGLDPADQLCTDDFAGHLAHNTNLSIKAILGIASYARCADMLGKSDIAEKYMTIARDYAAKWTVSADDGDHYRLTFDRTETWSQKYNLVWDKLLGFNIFPNEVTRKEVAYYLKKQNTWGLPLDNRRAWAKSDWTVWSATLATTPADFEAFVEPLWRVVNESKLRYPMPDWWWTDVPASVGFKARSVVGGYWIKMLSEKIMSEKMNLLPREAFDTEVDGKAVMLFTLRAGDIVMQVTNFGARVVTLFTPDRNGNYDDIVLGYENINRYVNNTGERFLGAVVGRYANRIAKGRFVLDGKTYQLPINNGLNTLHGGIKGLDNVVWNIEDATIDKLVLSYVSPDGEEGYPGELKIKMTYRLTVDNEFIVEYEAVTNKPTIVNFSHHSFFNLHGEGSGTITDHILTIFAREYVPIDEESIPLGNLAAVEGTPFDFQTPHTIGERIGVDDTQLKNGAGYDHCWVLNGDEGTLRAAARVYDPTSGRAMDVLTDQKGIQFYSGNFFDGNSMGKYGNALKWRESLALETQKFPDSPNNPSFPSARLDVGETYHQTCVYKFYTIK